MKARVGVAGFGAIGQHHARNLRQMHGVEFVGVADPVEGPRNPAAALGYRVFSSLDEWLAAGTDGVV